MNTQECYNLLLDRISTYYDRVDVNEIADLALLMKLFVVKLMFDLEPLPLDRDKDSSFQKLLLENISF